MGAEDWVRSKHPEVIHEIVHGTFVGGKTRHDIYYKRTLIGCDTLRRSAFAEAMRWLKKEKGNGGG